MFLVDLKVKKPYIFHNKLELYTKGTRNTDILFASIDFTADVQAKYVLMMKFTLFL